MGYLLLSIINAVALIIIFKLFGRYKIDAFQAVVFNYFFCVGTGLAFLGEFPIDGTVFQSAWWGHAVLLGCLFIGGFYCSAMTVAYFGMAISSVLQRMTLVISVPFAILVLQEPAGWLKVLGIALAAVAVVFINLPAAAKPPRTDLPATPNPPHPNRPTGWALWLFPIAVFVCGGSIECVLQFAQTRLLQPGREVAVFSIFAFMIAGLVGLLWLLGAMLAGRTQFAWRNLIAGIILGAPNYFAIYFLMSAFATVDKSIALPTKNITVMVTLSVIGFFFFKERLSPINQLGILVAIAAICLIAWS